MSTFTPGNVVYYGGEDANLQSMSLRDMDNYLSKRIIKFLEKDEVGITFPYAQNSMSIVNLKDIFSEEDVNKRRTFLNEELKKVKEDIMSKIMAAAELINQANVLASSAQTELIHISEASVLLEDIVDSVGWSSSSLSC